MIKRGFSKKTSSLLADIKLDIVFEIFFLIINNANINFQARTYNRDFILLEIYF